METCGVNITKQIQNKYRRHLETVEQILLDINWVVDKRNFDRFVNTAICLRDKINDIEKMMRIHHELNINIEGIDCIIGNNCILANGSVIAGHVTVGDYAILSGLVAVHQFIHIGEHAMVSGGSLVRKDVPPFTKAAKEPLSYVGINSVGLRRRGFTSEKIKEIQEIYRILYQKNYNTTQAVGIIEAEMEATPERDEIIDFIRNSSRGIMKGYSGNF